MYAEGVLTGSHKQVAESLPRGPVVMMRGGTTGVEKGGGRAPAASLGWKVKIKVNRKGLAYGCCRDSRHPLPVN